MDCDSLSKIIGHHCYPMTDDGSIVFIETPLRFNDGDDIPAYAELGQGSVRFYDDGDVYSHFAGIGVRMEDDAEKQFLSAIAKSHGLAPTDIWEVEIVAAPEQAEAAFAQYMTAMSAFVKWEKERDDALEVLYRLHRGQVA
ncbi:MAG: hypothetical protein JWQ01_3754 [Massilia sp.]|jgi:hypothetical protein|nr:hypothetical protein [Massilia sp.]